MSRSNLHDFCVVCSVPFNPGGSKEKLQKITSSNLITQGGSIIKTYTIKNVLSTIYNVGSLWNEPVKGEEKRVGACPECAKILTNLFIFYEKVNQVLHEQSLLSQMLRVMEQITGAKKLMKETTETTIPQTMRVLRQTGPKIVTKETARPSTIRVLGQTGPKIVTKETATTFKLNQITIQSQKKLEQIPADQPCYHKVPKHRMMQILQEITEKSNLTKKLDTVKAPFASQNKAILKAPSVSLDHDYASVQHKKVIHAPSRPPVVIAIRKENIQKPNEQKSLTITSASSMTSKNPASDQPLDTLSSNGKKINDEHLDDDVEMSSPCHGPEDNDQDEIIIERIIKPRPSAAASASDTTPSQKSINTSTAGQNENDDDDVEVKMEYMTCDTCQKIFIYEKNLKAHRKICRLRRKIPPPSLLSQYVVTSGDTSPPKSLVQKQQQEAEAQGSTGSSKSNLVNQGKTPPALHVPTIQKQLSVLANPGKLIVCALCRKKCESVEDCIRHLNHFHFPFKCEDCDIMYSTSKAWEHHMITKHGEEGKEAVNKMNGRNINNFSTSIHTKRNYMRYDWCSVCKTRFNSPFLLHQHDCPGPQIFQCPTCPKSFRKPYLLNRHSRSHEPKEKKVRKKRTQTAPLPTPDEEMQEGEVQYEWTRQNFKCDTCGKVFGNKQALVTHNKIHWSHRCLQCQKRFETAGRLEVHTPKCTGIQRPHVCSYGDPPCGQAYRKGAELKMHIRRKHTQEKLYMCHICGKGYGERVSLDFHVKRHDNYRPYICTVEGCGKAYVLGQSLRIHMNKHRGIKEYLCTTCGVSYSQKYILEMHMRKHRGELPYPCTLCDKKFPAPSYLRAHINQKHDGPHKCPKCGKGFESPSRLKKHSRIHSQCSICGAEFSNHKAIKAHMKRHELGVSTTKTATKKTKEGRSKVATKPPKDWENVDEEVELEDEQEEDSQDRRSSSNLDDDDDDASQDEDDDDDEYDNSRYFKYVEKRSKLKKKY